MKTDEFLNKVKNIINEDNASEDIFSSVKSILINQEENQGSFKIQQVEKELKSILKQKGYTFLDKNNIFIVFKDGKSVGGFFIDDDERWCFGEESDESSQRNESLDLSKLSSKDAEKLSKYFNDFAKDKTVRYDLIDKIEDILKNKYKTEKFAAGEAADIRLDFNEFKRIGILPMSFKDFVNKYNIKPNATTSEIKEIYKRAYNDFVDNTNKKVSKATGISFPNSTWNWQTIEGKLLKGLKNKDEKPVHYAFGETNYCYRLDKNGRLYDLVGSIEEMIKVLKKALKKDDDNDNRSDYNDGDSFYHSRFGRLTYNADNDTFEDTDGDSYDADMIDPEELEV